MRRVWKGCFFVLVQSSSCYYCLICHSASFCYMPASIPWMEEPGRLHSMGSLRVGHDWATSLSLFTLMHWRRKWQTTPMFLPGESQGRGSLVAAIYGVTQSWAQLKLLSSSSSSSSYDTSLPEIQGIIDNVGRSEHSSITQLIDQAHLIKMIGRYMMEFWWE